MCRSLSVWRPSEKVSLGFQTASDSFASKSNFMVCLRPYLERPSASITELKCRPNIKDGILTFLTVSTNRPKAGRPQYFPLGPIGIYFSNCSATLRKLIKAASIFSMISSAKISGAGRLSKSVKEWSFSQKISKLVFSR